MRPIFYLLMLFFCFTSNSSNAAIMKCAIVQEQNQETNHEIIYIDSSQVHISGAGIFAVLNDEMFPIKSLCGDYKGAFLEFECGNVSYGYWICPRCCGRNELWEIPYCQHCPYVLPRV